MPKTIDWDLIGFGDGVEVFPAFYLEPKGCADHFDKREKTQVGKADHHPVF